MAESLGVRPVLVVIVAALALRVGFLIPAIGNSDRLFTADAHEYVQVASHFDDAYLRSEDGEIFDLGVKRTPAYPAFLAPLFGAFGPASPEAALAQVLVSCVAVLLTYVAGMELVGRRAALWGAIVVATDPISIVYSSYFQPETLFTALVIAAAVLWTLGVRRGSLLLMALGGCALGMAALTRPIGLYLPVVLMPAALVLGRYSWRKRIPLSLVFAVAFAVPVGGWIARNQAITGVPILSSVEGTVNLFYRAARAMAAEGDGDVHAARRSLREVLASRHTPNMNPAEVSQLETSIAMSVLREHPIGFAKVTLIGSLRMLGGPGRNPLFYRMTRSDPDRADSLGKKLALGIVILLLVGVYVAVAVGIATLGARRAWIALIVPGVFLGYFLVASAGSGGYGRFRVPMVPFLAIFAGVGIERLLVAVARRRAVNRADRGEAV